MNVHLFTRTGILHSSPYRRDVHDAVHKETADLDPDELRPLRRPLLGLLHVLARSHTARVQVTVAVRREDVLVARSRRDGRRHRDVVLLTHLRTVLELDRAPDL